MLWIENASSASPGDVGGAVEGGDGDPEAARVDPRELRDVVGGLAGAEARLELGADLLDDRAEIRPGTASPAIRRSPAPADASAPPPPRKPVLGGLSWACQRPDGMLG